MTYCRMLFLVIFSKVIVTFQRCNEAVINCEYFQSWSLLDGCKKLREKNQLWSRWYNAFTPRFECPIDKVRILNMLHYYMTDGFQGNFYKTILEVCV